MTSNETGRNGGDRAAPMTSRFRNRTGIGPKTEWARYASSRDTVQISTCCRLGIHHGIGGQV